MLDLTITIIGLNFLELTNDPFFNSNQLYVYMLVYNILDFDCSAFPLVSEHLLSLPQCAIHHILEMISYLYL